MPTWLPTSSSLALHGKSQQLVTGLYCLSLALHAASITMTCTKCIAAILRPVWDRCHHHTYMVFHKSYISHNRYRVAVPKVNYAN